MFGYYKIANPEETLSHDYLLHGDPGHLNGFYYVKLQPRHAAHRIGRKQQNWPGVSGNASPYLVVIDIIPPARTTEQNLTPWQSKPSCNLMDHFWPLRFEKKSWLLRAIVENLVLQNG